MSDARFRPSSPNVVSQGFGDEQVVVNLLSGAYYSLEGSASVAWEAATAGRAVLPAVLARFSGDRDAIEPAVARFLEEMVSEGLLARLDTAPPEESRPVAAVPLAPRAPFVPPSWTRYRDMEELLLLDPIHEVGPGGWPEKAPDAAP